MKGRVCRKCWLWKPVLELVPAKKAKYGRSRLCKKCRNSDSRHRINNKKYVEANRTKVSKQKSAWYYKNKERILKERKKYYEANLEVIKKYKSDYTRNNREKVREAGARRRAKLRRSFVESVDYSVIYERDGGICHICNTFVHPDELDMDHVIPINRGGEHSYNNIKVSHGICNRRKGTKLMSEFEMENV